MTRSAAAKATEAADALLEWLRTQPPQALQRQGPPGPLPARLPSGADNAAPGGNAAGHPEERAAVEGVLVDPSPAAPASERPAPAQDLDSIKPVPHQATRPGPGHDNRCIPLRLAHTDWLHHRLSVAGPEGEVAAFRAAAAGAGTIPWHFDLERMEEDFFHLLVAPPARPGSPTPQQRTLSIAGARIVAGQLRDAVRRRHELAVARAGSRACPFDLHALVPVPDDILRRGPDDPASLAWLWAHWGTTQELRHVTADTAASQDGRHQPAEGEAVFRLTFWSADWTPWRALAQLALRWPALRFDTRPTYEAS